MQRADGILILEAGGIVEHGPRLDLAADPDSRFPPAGGGMEEVLA